MDFDKIEVYGVKDGEKFLISSTILKELNIGKNVKNDLLKIFGADKKILASELKERCCIYWKVSTVTAYNKIKRAGLKTERIGVKVYYYRPEM
ncbi:MAG: hypothetical protein WC175_01815 [Candidatus Dojkabacteria bacterium]|jgi:hypothetical protein